MSASSLCPDPEAAEGPRRAHRGLPDQTSSEGSAAATGTPTPSEAALTAHRAPATPPGRPRTGPSPKCASRLDSRGWGSRGDGAEDAASSTPSTPRRPTQQPASTPTHPGALCYSAGPCSSDGRLYCRLPRPHRRSQWSHSGWSWPCPSGNKHGCCTPL